MFLLSTPRSNRLMPTFGEPHCGGEVTEPGRSAHRQRHGKRLRRPEVHHGHPGHQSPHYHCAAPPDWTARAGCDCGGGCHPRSRHGLASDSTLSALPPALASDPCAVTRLLADLPWHGHTVRVCLHGRRFRCTDDACSRRTFRERLPQLAPVYSRRTPALRTALQAVGFALDGQPGARLAAALHLPGSRMKLLRLLHAAPLPTLRRRSADAARAERGRLGFSARADLWHDPR